ncbi:hypothetical protein N8522_06075 [Akkermansiaceae bacterium]|nr:hypothetical protein [Akkermansiaceae bacterium]MDB4813526.1 hypothetical protein [bacterium]MDB4301594.1 hypothetical protein [Akkermansiaceae bacterium]MDB4309372.1 hypothetical protein [Akkermansiaceae bacterium]MDB4320841.1 hypothetical protein [Akkermansiaceae bacterium]
MKTHSLWGLFVATPFALTSASALEFEKPVRMMAGDQPVKVASPGYAAPAWAEKQWAKKIAAVQKRLQTSESSKEEQQKVMKEFQTLIKSRSEFQKEERTGFVWLYLGK